MSAAEALLARVHKRLGFLPTPCVLTKDAASYIGPDKIIPNFCGNSFRKIHQIPFLKLRSIISSA